MTIPVQSARLETISRRNFERVPGSSCLNADDREAVRVVGEVFAFRANRYVIDELIDWEAVPHDPIYQLTFPQRGMLESADYERVRALMAAGGGVNLARAVSEIRSRMSPHPGGQETDNVPLLDGERLWGLQHKYRETVLFFPSAGQTCHAHCTYCFRWAQFTDVPGHIRFAGTDPSRLADYLRLHAEVTDVILTGGDPMVMRASKLAETVEPLLDPTLEGLRTVRIGTKALAFWPHRFVSAPDADDVLRLLERLADAGLHVALMAHVSHPRELATDVAQTAVRRLLATGAVIRMQAPIVRHVNDSSECWADLWSHGVALGMVPYYAFVARDTGAHRYFEVPLYRAHEIVKEAQQQVSGLARTARGPVMSTWPGKVHMVGSADVGGERVFVLQFLQAREPELVGMPFFAAYDTRATWLTDLRPAFGAREFPFGAAA